MARLFYIKKSIYGSRPDLTKARDTSKSHLYNTWTSCKTCTHTKIKDHSWKPGHKLELRHQSKICIIFYKYLKVYIITVNCDNCCVNDNLCI